MKKIAVRTLLLSLVLSIAAALGFVAPSYSTSSESITQSDHYLQGTLNSQLWRTPAFTAVGFVSGGTTFTITPALPAGLSMSTSGDTATISGTPTVAYAPVTHNVTASGTSTTTGSAATATATIQVSVASVITVTSNVSQLPASTLVTTPITASFSHDSFISGTTGGVSLTTTGFVPNNTTDCSDVTLSVSSAGCTIYATQNSVSYNWTGIDFDANTNFVVTMLANAFTTPNGQGAGSWAGLNINLSQTPGSPPQMNFGGAMVTIGSSSQNQQQNQQQNQSQPPTSSAPVASVDLSAAIGSPIAGASAPFAASGLLGGSSWDITVRSTPNRIDFGTVPQNGSIAGSALMPSNLEPGWHTITFTSTAADGTETKDVLWFKISANGTLLSKSESQPAELALTGVMTAGAIPLSLVVLMLGFIAFFVAREINPDFMRVMTLTRNEDGELDFVKRRIRSIDF